MGAKSSSGRKESRKRILLVDDHPMMRAGLAHFINQQSDLIVCCEAVNASQAMNLLALRSPQLAVVDISLDDKDGLELIKVIHELHPGVHVLVMSTHDESIYAERALRAGARGYIMKSAGAEMVLQAIRQILTGKIYLSNRMSERILKSYSNPRKAAHSSPIENLTDREFEVFKLVGEGLVTREIARRLSISPKTVDVHRQRIREKLELPNTTSFIQHAVRWVETQSNFSP